METPAWIDRLEDKLGGWSIPHMVRGLVVLNALAFMLDMANPGFTASLVLENTALHHGEWWRAVTFLFAAAGTTSSIGIFFFIIWMMVTWMFGDGLEAAMGSFKVTLYLVIPAVLLTALVWFVPGAGAYNAILLASLFFAFATFYPDLELMLFFILPVKCKWLALLSAAFILVQFVSLPELRLMILASLSTYFLFFLPAWWTRLRLRAAARIRRERFKDHDDGE